MLCCHACGGTVFTDRAILWDELAETWELSPEERAYVDRQQGTVCSACGASLRSSVLAAAILAAVGSEGSLADWVTSDVAARLDLLEVNEAGSLSPMLRQMKRHVLGTFPEVDMQALPYADASFDLVVHSDTLEHVPDPLKALQECRRVLRPGGALCFTVPTIVGRLTRSTAGRPPSWHGFPKDAGDDGLRVQTEFGADAWVLPARAGFQAVTVTHQEFPAALALTAWNGSPRPLAMAQQGGLLRRLFGPRG